MLEGVIRDKNGLRFHLNFDKASGNYDSTLESIVQVAPTKFRESFTIFTKEQVLQNL